MDRAEVERKRGKRNTVTWKLWHSMETGINHLALIVVA